MLTRFLLAALVSATLAAAIACSAGGSPGGGDATVDPPSPVRGLITRVRTSPSGEVEGITLKTDDGRTLDFIVQFDRGQVVSADHLKLHQQDQLPVQVSFRSSGDRRVAYRIADG